jgi:hypothetical protein
MTVLAPYGFTTADGSGTDDRDDETEGTEPSGDATAGAT